MARLLIEAGVGRLDKLSPVRRIRSTVEHPEDLADAVKALGSLAGNAQRIYEFMKKTRQIDDAALSALKINIQQTAARVRAALGNFDDA
jgi:ribosomal protein L30/L7E